MIKFLVRLLLWIGIGVLLVAVLFVAFAPSRFNILVIGSDQRGTERARSDVMFIFSLAKWPNQESALITIPRDTQVEIPEYGLDKLTHAYVYGEVEEGSVLGNRELTKRTIEENLDIRIDGTVEVTFESFVEIVDALGGVTLESAGALDGQAALAQVRNRYRPGGDFARTADQRELFRALLTKVRDQANAELIWKMAQESDQIRIDIPSLRFGHFGAAFVVLRAGQLSLGDVHDEALPGQGQTLYAPNFGQNLYFWVLDEPATEELVETYLR